MIRLLFTGSIVFGLMGCRYPTPAAVLPSSVEIASDGHPNSCADTSFVFRPEKGSFQFGLDPVETERYILESRTFKKALGSSNPGMTDVRYRVQRFEDSAVLKIVVSAETSDDALLACQALSRTALDGVVSDNDIAGVKEWLADQRKEIQRRKAAAEQDLASFLAEHNLTALEPSDQISLYRERLIALNKDKDKTTDKKRRAQIADIISKLESDKSEMSMLKLSHERLRRSVVQENQLLDAIDERETDLMFNTRTASSLITLEPCAPTRCLRESNE